MVAVVIILGALCVVVALIYGYALGSEDAAQREQPSPELQAMEKALIVQTAAWQARQQLHALAEAERRRGGRS